ncbi:MAG TPA: RNA 2',3'-cyclic phosphodiesterase [Aggregatilineales bacterium]|nr:RNA 2',3'-cyclic phosphodiesterase [Aggregatilineales bacterium]
MAEPWRLFIAVELPPEALDVLEGLQSELKQAAPQRAVRWVRPEGIHVTLKFLGDAPQEAIGEVQAALDAAVQGHGPFNLRAEGVGAFPNTSRPRVVWAGIEGDVRQLKALRRSVEEHVSPLGYPTEGRSYTPHLTLGRVQNGIPRRQLEAVGALVENNTVGELARWRVDAVSLMRSELKPDGAVYTEVYRVPLGEG